MNSIWVDDIKRIRFEPLKQNKSTDVLIIGGGIAGILCAYKLKQKGIDCILVEADQICGGITKNTTAKITFAHGLIYDKIINKYGEDIARLYLEAQIDACEEYNALCQNIECNYEKKNSYVYSLQSIRIVDFVSEIVNANRYDAIFVQTKTREPPRQRYDRTLSVIPKPIHYRQVNQPYNSTRVKIDGTTVFSFGHFHSFAKTVIQS